MAEAVNGEVARVLLVKEDFVCNWKGAVLAGECGLTEKGDHIDQARTLFWLQLGLTFLRSNFAVPDGCRLGLTWFQYIGNPFPAIAMVWDSEETPADVVEVGFLMEQAMEKFNRAINWRALSAVLDQQK